MLRDLLECLGDVGDPRDPAKVEHRLVDVLAIAVCAVLACAESFEDIALYGRSKRGSGAFAFKGQMMDMPHLTRARKIVERARRAGVL